MSEWVDVAGVGDFETGCAIVVDVDGAMIGVFRLEDGFYAIEDVCTHDGGDLVGGCVQGDEVICPRHGAHFSIRTGKALSAPAYEDVPTFPVRIENGRVQVRDDRWD